MLIISSLQLGGVLMEKLFKFQDDDDDEDDDY